MELWYALVELLPFEWAQPDSMYFMKNALLAILVISPLFGLLSTMVVESRMSFFSDALGHSAFTGIAIGSLCGLAEPMWCAVVFAVIFAVLFTYVRRHTNLASDTVIGVFSSTAVALGIFIATLGGGSFTKFNALLVGDILSVEPGKIGLLAAILLVVVVLWVCSFNQLMLASVHPALADSRGIRVFWQESLFAAAIAVVVTVSMTWVGLLVINSLLVLPAAAGRNLARNLRQYHLFSVVGALAAGIAGLLTSYQVGASTGACITLYLAIYFALTFCFRTRRM
ncbi:metal ABC transporter permease [Pseudoflavonifractor sp. DSM 107456]|uniref:Metal ABC transporter permease n=1 Tax=Pseudoflavonifractor gallinarum TaxID=2779352 RepID=A0ABR9R8L3_9FIRM|nr:MULTISPECIES: metal ABC transporter permease [Eubacteriales]MBE5055037.1 metal ABC transporter permease [Pseudoflavonifractor gallinarum]